LIGAVSFNWLLWQIKYWKVLPRKWGDLLLLTAPFLFLLVSLTYSQNLPTGIFSIEKRLSLFAFPVIFCTVPALDGTSKRFLYQLQCYAASAASAVCLVLAALRYGSGVKEAFFWKQFTNILNFNPLYFSVFMCVALAWCLVQLEEVVEQKAQQSKIALSIQIILIEVSILFSSSKIGLAISAIIMLYYGSRILRHSATTSFIIFLALVGSFLWVMLNGSVLERFVRASNFRYSLSAPTSSFNELTNRLALIECSWLVAKDHLLVGAGIGDAQDELNRVFRSVDYKFGYMDSQNPHNEYLSQLVSTGMLGLIIFVICYFYYIRKSLKRGNSYGVAFLVIFAIAFTVESMLARNKGIVFFGLFNSLFFVTVDTETRVGP
jgi:hypothetical protein